MPVSVQVWLRRANVGGYSTARPPSANQENVLQEIARLAAAGTLRVAGLMSGTSCDGVDAAIVDVTGREIDVRAFRTFPYAPSVRSAVLAACSGEASVADICSLNVALGEVFAEALLRLVDAAGISPDSLDLIGSHGQTVCHLPDGVRLGRRRVRSTLQLGEPCVIAERTGATTVADFRPRDLAAGGQGAPLVPLADWLLLARDDRCRLLLNIGGIANVTWLPAGGSPDDVLAFDTGPGNMVMDRFVVRATGGRRRFDRDGRLAGAGRVREDLLAEWLAHPYFPRRPPKSTGREAFGTGWADRQWRAGRRKRAPAEDMLATAAALTAESVARACRRFLPEQPGEVICSGGGARNPVLMGMLAARLAPASVSGSDAFGLDADAKEAVAFALLAVETIRGRAGNVPSATGAGGPAVLGKIVPGRPGGGSR